VRAGGHRLPHRPARPAVGPRPGPAPGELAGPRVLRRSTRTGCRGGDRGRSPTMLRGRGGEERGSVAITVVLAMTVLLGFAALVVDIGLNWAARTSAQTAADSAALPGASRLVADGPAAALGAVEGFLDANVDGLVPGGAGGA